MVECSIFLRSVDGCQQIARLCPPRKLMALPRGIFIPDRRNQLCDALPLPSVQKEHPWSFLHDHSGSVIPSARAGSRSFSSSRRFKKRRNTVCISCFLNRTAGGTDPLSSPGREPRNAEKAAHTVHLILVENMNQLHAAVAALQMLTALRTHLPVSSNHDVSPPPMSKSNRPQSTGLRPSRVSGRGHFLLCPISQNGWNLRRYTSFPRPRAARTRPFS